LADITAQMQALMAKAVEAGAAAEDFSGNKTAVDKTVEVTVEKEREAPRQYFADVLRKPLRTSLTTPSRCLAQEPSL